MKIQWQISPGHTRQQNPVPAPSQFRFQTRWIGLISYGEIR
jgi:hypothetical protein